MRLTKRRKRCWTTGDNNSVLFACICTAVSVLMKEAIFYYFLLRFCVEYKLQHGYLTCSVARILPDLFLSLLVICIEIVFVKYLSFMCIPFPHAFTKALWKANILTTIYLPLCPHVCPIYSSAFPSIRPSVHPSIRPSVHSLVNTGLRRGRFSWNL
jgi:hypothetical protein